MERSRKSHQIYQDSEEEDLSSTSTSHEDIQEMRNHWLPTSKASHLSPSVIPHHIPSLPLHFKIFSTESRADQYFPEISVYNTRTQRYITKQEQICIDSGLSSPEKAIQEIAYKLRVDKEYVVFQNSEDRTEESCEDPFFVILPQEKLPDTIILILQCHYFDQFINKRRCCLRIDSKLKVAEVKQTIKSELKWKGVEIYFNKSYMPDDRTLKEFNLPDFSQLHAMNSVAKTVTFLHQPTSDTDTRYRLCIDTCDSVKMVKEKIIERFQSDLAQVKTNDDCLHITCSNEVLNDEHCFGTADKYYRDNNYQLHFAPADAVLCNLNYQNGKERMRDWERRLILISPACSTAQLRKEAAKHMRVDPKAVKLRIGNKQRIEEMSNISEVNMLHHRCTILAGIKKKKTLLVKHPTSNKPEKIANLYALEPVSTLRKQVAKRYGINELQIVLKYKGTVLEDNQLLYNYPVKNNMVLELHIFERRLNIVAHVIFKRKRLNLIIDDSEKTTIGEILKYCAVNLQYKSSCSRCVYSGQCLDKNATLLTAGLTSGCNILIIYFSEDDCLGGGLQKIFMVDVDGRTIPRYGSVAGGLLLHASKKVKVLSNGGRDSEKETLPEGIHTTETPKDLKIHQNKADAADGTNVLQGSDTE